ncbi:MAG: Flp pilus assembly complex ATPase component TadA, partial [Phycisphaeraceae bacterium]|nr:Flp pilus assembly complex ATPase component TadA [Phycisphaeraceae bacterium]
MLDIKVVLEHAVRQDASDVHINVGMPPIIRHNTELVELPFPAVTQAEALAMVKSMIDDERFARFERERDVDFSSTLPDGHRFRVNAHFQRETAAISFRIIPNQVLDAESLNLPTIVKELTELPRGLVLVTGPTGSGKSTTLAAMIAQI